MLLMKTTIHSRNYISFDQKTFDNSILEWNYGTIKKNMELFCTRWASSTVLFFSNCRWHLWYGRALCASNRILKFNCSKERGLQISVVPRSMRFCETSKKGRPSCTLTSREKVLCNSRWYSFGANDDKQFTTPF